MFMKLRHLSSLALALTCTATVFAQSQSSPLPVNTEAINYCDVGSMYSYCYYTYTPSVSEYVYLDGLRSYGVTYQNGSVTEQVPYASYASQVSGNYTAFYANAGVTYLIEGYTYTQTYVRFTFSSKPGEFNNGQDINNPIIAENGVNYLPCTKEGSSYYDPCIPVYLTYTATEGGKLVLSFPAQPSDALYYSTGDVENGRVTFNYNAAAGSYRATIQVEAGQTVNFKATSSNPILGIFSIEPIVPGSSQEDAIICAEGENVIPAAAGNYWYTFTTPSSPSRSMVTVTSEAVATMDLLGSSGNNLQSFNAIHMRYPIYSSITNYLLIHKEEATAADETFDFSTAPMTGIDVIEGAVAIESGVETTTLDFGGEYFYKLTSPATGAWFLNADFAEGTTSEASFYVYSDPGSYYTSYGPSIHMEAEANHEYYVKVQVPYNVDGVSFTVSFAEIQPGETRSNPIVANAGLNNMAASKELFYTYTAQADCWVNVAVENVELPFVFLTSGPTVSTLDVNDHQNRFEATAGETYLMMFRNVTAGASFTISEAEYGVGESYATALQAVIGENTLPEPAGKTWYKYTATENCFLTMTTTVPYSHSTEIRLYINQIDNDNSISMPSDYSWVSGYSWSEMKATIQAGDECYILISTTDARTEGAAFNLSVSPIGEGQSYLTAIPMNLEFTEEGQAVFQLPAISTETWYSFEVPYAGLLSITKEETMTASLYGQNGRDNIASFSWSNISNESVTAGTYYIKVDNNYYDMALNFSMRQPGPGETASTAFEIPVTGNPTLYHFGNKPSELTAIYYSIELNEGLLSMECPAWYVVGSLYGPEDNYVGGIREMTTDVYGFTDIVIPAAGRYTFKFTSFTADYYNSEATSECTFSGTALEGGVGVGTLGASEAATEYYTLSGIKVQGKPAPGLYIIRKGDKVGKVTVR